MKNPNEPQDEQIMVSIESGANCQSRNEHFVDAFDLGFDDREAWDNTSEEEKMQAVIEYWNGNGYPEISWED